MDNNTQGTKPFSRSFDLADVIEKNSDAVKFTDFENFFNIYQDADAYYRFNLNSTLYISVPYSRLKTHVCQHDAHWPTISYEIYGTVRLAWVLMKVNNITPNLSFNVIPAGSKVKYLDRSDITTVLDGFNK